MGEAREVMDRLTEVAFFEAFPDASYVRNTPHRWRWRQISWSSSDLRQGARRRP